MEAWPDENSQPLGQIWHQYRIPILLGGASILCIIFSIVLLVKSSQSVAPIMFSNVEGEATDSSKIYQNITIDIEGAVEKPGVYTVPVGSRVEDAIAMAGGISAEADEEFISKSLNRAQKLVDGAKLYIPKAGEIETSYNLESLSRRQQTSYNDSIQNQGGLVGGSYLISINTATSDELDTLPGVGPVTATKIISNRPYSSLEELVARKVIGTALFEKLKNSLTL